MKKIDRFSCGNGDGMFDNKKGYWVSYEDHLKIVKELEDKINFAHSSLQLPSFKELNIEMKKVSEKLYTDAKQTEKNYFEAGFNYCHHIIDKSLNK